MRAATAEPTRLLVEVKNLRAYFPIRGSIFSRVVANVKAVQDISFSVAEGEVLGLVGRVRFWEDHGWARNRGAHRPDIGRGAL